MSIPLKPVVSARHLSLDSRYRSPLGAMPTGEKVRLWLEITEGQVEGVALRVYWGDRSEDIPMAREKDGRYAADLAVGEKPCVLWYQFVLTLPGGRHLYCGLPFGQMAGTGSVYTEPPASFQLTVYDRDFQTPDWVKKGVMYQIFPDRFKQGDPRNASKGRRYHEKMGRTVRLHESWDELPDYLPAEGEDFYTPCDYFGGDLKGIEDSLPYLKEMGVTVLYLNPIVEADSNHRYNTGDYKKVDPLLGSNAAFASLCLKAGECGIRVLCDGVFSHTGSDSIYFNKLQNYNNLGAYQGEQSPYYRWFDFFGDRDHYRSWWGFDTLPEVNEGEPSWQEYVITGRGSVFDCWLRLGASGFRLDVADELPDEIIALMRKKVKSRSENNLLLGEVWEDATIKESYGHKRQYALGRGLDSVMNYPFRGAVIDYLLEKSTALELRDFLCAQQGNYPKPMYYSLMNLLSSHDVARIRTVLGTEIDGEGMERPDQAAFLQGIGDYEAAQGKGRTRLAMALQFAVPGIPSTYYGDEWGMQGLKDPFNRAPFRPEGEEELHQVVQRLGSLRAATPALQTGYAAFFAPAHEVIGVLRFCLDGQDAFGEAAEDGTYLVLCNRDEVDQELTVDLRQPFPGLDGPVLARLRAEPYAVAENVFSAAVAPVEEGKVALTLPAEDFAVYRLR